MYIVSNFFQKLIIGTILFDIQSVPQSRGHCTKVEITLICLLPSSKKYSFILETNVGRHTMPVSNFLPMQFVSGRTYSSKLS